MTTQQRVANPQFGRPLTPDELAAALRVSKWTVYDSIKRGEIHAIRLGRCIRIPQAELARLLGEPPDGGTAA